jgi:hypothetical protein
MAWALLEEHVDNPSSEIKIAAINALGMAYAGSETLPRRAPRSLCRRRLVFR